MSKLFCMLCPYYKPTQYELGFCTQKHHYLNKLQRNCTIGRNDSIGWIDEVIEYWRRGAELAGERHQLLLDFYQSLESTMRKEE